MRTEGARRYNAKVMPRETKTGRRLAHRNARGLMIFRLENLRVQPGAYIQRRPEKRGRHEEKQVPNPNDHKGLGQPQGGTCEGFGTWKTKGFGRVSARRQRESRGGENQNRARRNTITGAASSRRRNLMK